MQSPLPSFDFSLSHSLSQLSPSSLSLCSPSIDILLLSRSSLSLFLPADESESVSHYSFFLSDADILDSLKEKERKYLERERGGAEKAEGEREGVEEREKEEGELSFSLNLSELSFNSSSLTPAPAPFLSPSRSSRHVIDLDLSSIISSPKTPSLSLPTSSLAHPLSPLSPSLSSPTLSTISSPRAKEFTLDDLCLHKSDSDLWVSVRGDVFDITGFGTHPGGRRVRVHLLEDVCE